MNASQLRATGELAATLKDGGGSLRLPLGKTLIVEHKTNSEDIGLGSMYWAKLTLDAQISDYYVGARALGFEPDGVLYDVLRKTALRPYEISSKRAAPENPASYRDRILEDIERRPDYYYQRGIVVRLEDEERDAAFDKWQTADQIRVSRNEGRWPRNVDSCSQYNRLCDYWSVCSGEASIDDVARFARGPSHPELEGKYHLPVLTSSSSRAFRACARRYYYAFELGVRPTKAPAAPLHFGQRIHLALEAWMTSGHNLEEALFAIQTPVYDYDAARAEAMIRGYHARWCDEPWDILAVEKEFSALLVNPSTGASSRTFLRAGRIDGIVRTRG